MFRSGRDPINPLRIGILRRRGLTWREGGRKIARDDGRKVPYTAAGVKKAYTDYERGLRDEDGERYDAKPASCRRFTPSLPVVRLRD